jgi:H+/Cl- antiporter ClcA
MGATAEKKIAWRGAFRMFLCLIVVGVVTGSLSAVFLLGLDIVTEVHQEARWLLWLLPLVGVGMVHGYQRFGGAAREGSHLLVDEMQHWRGRVPRRMAPFILFATWLTHLFGGSAGREGTALQMGASVAAWMWRGVGLTKSASRCLMMAGMAAGFGAVFGTPWAAAVFALELPVRGRWEWRSLAPCLLAAWVGHITCMAWGVQHSDFRALVPTQSLLPSLTLGMSVSLLMAAVAFGGCGRLFVFLSESAPRWWMRWVKQPLWRPVIGAGCLIVMVECFGLSDYLGLGLEASREGGVSLLSSFQPGGAEWWSWLAKIIFTVITLSSGFKGGEVTPLFFVGATLGHAMATMTGQPVGMFAGLGLVAVFAAASNAPLACVLLGCELFGVVHMPVVAVVCLIAYGVSGRAGIYHRSA